MQREAGKVKIGVLAIQGSVVEHARAVERAGAEVVFVKEVGDLNVDGLIIPGGESTTIGKLLQRFGLREAIMERAEKGLPIYGTCAGAILMAKEIVGREVAKMDLMAVKIERNGYGRQLDSFDTEVDFCGKRVRGTFIRAPRIVSVGEGVEVLAREGEEIVAAREGNLLITTFHPEMTEDGAVHEYFVGMCVKALL